MKKFKKISLEKYTIFINPSFEYGVDFSIIDDFNKKVVVSNLNYSIFSDGLNGLFDYICDIIIIYEEDEKRKKNGN